MTARTPLDDLARRASHAVDEIAGDRTPRPTVESMRRRLRRRRQRQLAASAGAVVVVAASLVGVIAGGSETPTIVDRPSPDPAPTDPVPSAPEPTAPATTGAVTADGWTLVDDEDIFGGQGVQSVADGAVVDGAIVLVGIDAANAADGRVRPGVWRSGTGDGWQRRGAAVEIDDGWAEAGVLMRGVAAAPGGRLVAVGYANHEPREEPAAWVSTDGRTWSVASVPEHGGSAAMHNVAWDGGQFVAVGSLDGQPTTWTSTDGDEWSDATTAQGEGTFHTVMGHDGRLLAVSVIGDSSELWTTDPADAPQWRRVELPAPYELSSIRRAGDGLVAVGLHRPDGVDYDGALLTSPDGIDWEVDDRSTGLAGPGDQFAGDVLEVDGTTIVSGTDDRRGVIWTGVGGGQLEPADPNLFPADSHVGPLLETPDGVLAVGGVQRDTGPDALLWRRDTSSTGGADTTALPAGCDAGVAPDYQGVPAGWEVLTPPPAPRTRAATVWTGERLLLVGGDSNLGGILHPSVFAYDPDDRTWTCGTDAPFPVTGVGTAWTGGRLYAVGGTGAAVYDPAADAWQTLPDPPDAAASRPFAMIWTGDEMLVWGSRDRSAPTATGAAYDPATGTWRELPPAPVEINRGQAAWTGTEMVIFGARLDGGNISTTPTAVGAAYDPGTDAWRELPPVDLSPQAVGVAWTGEVLLAWDYGLAASAYDPAADTWSELDPLPLDAGECSPDSVVLADGSVFAWYCGQAALLDADTRTWREIATPITTHWGRSAAGDEVQQVAGTPTAAGSAIYFAGATHEGSISDLWRWQRTPG